MTHQEEKDYLAALLWQRKHYPNRGFTDRPETRDWAVVSHLERMLYLVEAGSLIHVMDGLRSGRITPLTPSDRSPST